MRTQQAEESAAGLPTEQHMVIHTGVAVPTEGQLAGNMPRSSTPFSTASVQETQQLQQPSPAGMNMAEVTAIPQQGSDAAGIDIAGRLATGRHSDGECQGACLAVEIPAEICRGRCGWCRCCSGCYGKPFACPHGSISKLPSCTYIAHVLHCCYCC